MEIHEIHRKILRECFCRQTDISQTRNLRDYAAHELLVQQRRHGPRYIVSEWFPDADNPTAQKRFLRAVYSLADNGFLHLTKSSEGGKLEHIKLTEAGQKLIAELNQPKVTSLDELDL